MSEINEFDLERRYLAYLEELGPLGRIAKSMQIFDEYIFSLRSEVALKYPSLCQRGVENQAAKILYAEEPTTLELLDTLARMERIDLL